MYDTMLMAKREAPTKSASLDACVSRYLPEYSGYKMESQGNIAQAWTVPTDILLRRNAMDAKVTYLLWRKLYDILTARGVRDETLHEDAELAMVAERIERRGFYCPESAMMELKTQQLAVADKYLKELREITGDQTFNPASPAQVKVKFVEILGLSAKDAEGLATDWKTLQFVKLSQPGTRAARFAECVIEYRSAEKLVGTYVEGYAKCVGSDGFIHADLRWPGTLTWRFSSSEPNLQNIPREGIVRSMFCGPGDLWVWEADYSQFELRAAAALSQDPILVEAFLRGLDLHTDMARTLGWATPTKEQRAIGKVLNFGTGYGAGAGQIQTKCMEGDLLISLQEAGRYVETYWKRYGRLNEWRRSVMESARKGERIWGPAGQYAWTLDDMLVAQPGDVEGGLRSIYNAPIQSPSTRYTLMAAGRIEKLGCPASLQVHDSLMGYAKREDMEEVEKIVTGAMREVASDSWWGKVPVLADFKCGPNWNNMKAPTKWRDT